MFVPLLLLPRPPRTVVFALHLSPWTQAVLTGTHRKFNMAPWRLLHTSWFYLHRLFVLLGRLMFSYGYFSTGTFCSTLLCWGLHIPFGNRGSRLLDARYYLIDSVMLPILISVRWEIVTDALPHDTTNTCGIWWQRKPVGTFFCVQAWTSNTLYCFLAWHWCLF